MTGLAPYAHADENKENLVKAAFIYNFIKFVEWPDSKAIAQQTHIDICIAGTSGLSNTSQVFKAASNAKLSLSLVDWRNDPSHCHVLFIAASSESKLADILAAVKGQPVLTVSDMDNFVDNGGMIGFVTKDNNVKLEVNTRPVKEAGMRINAQLLEVALKVVDR